MKARIVEFKAQDAKVSLTDVPFDSTRMDLVTKAFLTLGGSIEEVAEMVHLQRRTNQALYFNITGSDSKLRPFFNQYYNHLSWEEILAKYGSKVRKNKLEKTEEKKEEVSKEEKVKKIDVEEKKKQVPEQKKAETNKTELKKDIANFFSRVGINPTQIKYNPSKKSISLHNVGSDTASRLTKLFMNEGNPKFLARYDLELGDFKTTEEPKILFLKNLYKN